MRSTWFLSAVILCAACKGNRLNIFSIDDDIELGQQVRDEILNDPENFPILPEVAAPEAYGHLYRIRDAVLASGEVRYGDDFEWEVYLVDDPETLNAFATPGGYLFFYTGLVAYLDEEDHFAGVMGHEMAHAAERHSTQQLTEAYGITTVISIALGEGDAATLANIAASVASLTFSRTDEAESDARSVEYLCGTDYAADGTAGFFAKLEAEGGIDLPEFLSTHPSPGNRVEDIRAAAEEAGCSTELNPNAQWAEFQNSLL